MIGFKRLGGVWDFGWLIFFYGLSFIGVDLRSGVKMERVWVFFVSVVLLLGKF